MHHLTERIVHATAFVIPEGVGRGAELFRPHIHRRFRHTHHGTQVYGLGAGGIVIPVLESKNSSMGQPLGIDPTTRRTMSNALPWSYISLQREREKERERERDRERERERERERQTDRQTD